MKFNVYKNASATGTFIRIMSGDNHIDYVRSSQTEFEADVLCDAIRSAMGERIEKIRRDAYRAGWSDAKKKAKKKTTFSDCLNLDHVGY